MRSALTSFLFLVVGCSNPTTPSHVFCHNTLNPDDLSNLLNGNMTIDLAVRDRGADATQAAGTMLTSIGTTVIDFGTLDFTKPMFNAQGLFQGTVNGYQITLANSALNFQKGGVSFWIRFYFASSFGSFHTGDLVPNLLDPSLYFTSVTAPAVAGGNVTYSPGELFGLIDPAATLTFTGTTLNAVHVSIKILPAFINFSFGSNAVFAAPSPRTSDAFTLSLVSVQGQLSTVATKLAADGYGISIDGSTYASPFYGINQTFSASAYVVTQSSEGWNWYGTHQSVATTGNDIYYLIGYVSNREQNTTDYYCDSANTQSVGTSFHDISLRGGVFRFADQTLIPFGLALF